MTYEDLKRKAHRMQSEGTIPDHLTRGGVADWAYGNAVIENSKVTRAMAERAVEKLVEE